ncbi:hypothetical protein [Vaginella massiliensis]|uniref:hypothetical protein n=1 Tax=Vaginella massiliensis TaxID=1816680 RepID=UPI000AE71654|nr:hypothetical protein [Vaginella massiliensis]
MNKFIKITIGLCLFFMPMLLFGQSDGEYSNILKYLKGDGAFEKWFMEAFTTLDTQVNIEATKVALLGRAIGGFGALLYLGYLGWQMIAGDREWEIMPMFRPIFIGFLLIYWSGFTNLIQKPFIKLAQPGKEIFADIEDEVNDLRVKRFKKQSQLLEFLIKKKAEEDAKEEIVKGDQSWWQQLGDDIADSMEQLVAPIKEWAIRMSFQGQKAIAEIIEFVALAILRVCVYLIFFIQKIWSYILIVLGPVAVGMALIPGFENSLYSWVAKFININLYTFVAYTIINIGQQLIASGYTMEIQRLDLLISDTGVVDDLNALLLYMTGYGIVYNQLFTVVAYVVTGIGVLMTPTIADTIVTAGGAGAATKMKSAAAKVASAGKTAVIAAKTGGVAAAGQAATAAKDTARAAQQTYNTLKNKRNVNEKY